VMDVDVCVQFCVRVCVLRGHPSKKELINLVVKIGERTAERKGIYLPILEKGKKNK